MKEPTCEVCAHDSHAFAQMERDARKKDVQNLHRGDELRMEAHRLFVMAAS